MIHIGRREGLHLQRLGPIKQITMNGPKFAMQLSFGQGPVYIVGQLVVIIRQNLQRQHVAKGGYHGAKHQGAFYEDEGMYQHIPYT